jgi:hypothetical protein
MRTVFAVALAAALGATGAQADPSAPITVIVGFAPGGPTDTLARIITERMRISLGQPLIVENVPGATGTIAIGRVVRSPPDGRTLSMGNWTTHVGAPAIYPIAYDVLRDLEPVSLLPIAPLLITARKGFLANDIQELIAWLKANPGQATAAIVGVGSSGHVSLIDFEKKTGTRFQFVPYRGGGPAMNDLVAGQIDVRHQRRCRICRAARSRPMPFWPRPAGWQRRTFRRSTKQECPAFTLLYGTAFGRQRTRRRTSLPGSTPQSWIRSPIRWCASGSPISVWKCRRAKSSRRRRFTRTTKPRSRSGGRSSKQPASRRSDLHPGHSGAYRVGRRA